MRKTWREKEGKRRRSYWFRQKVWQSSTRIGLYYWKA